MARGSRWLSERAALIRELEALKSRNAELEAEADSKLPTEHYIAQLRQIAMMAAEDRDLQLAQLGSVLGEALDVVEVHQLLIDQRIEELGRSSRPAQPDLYVVGGGR